MKQEKVTEDQLLGCLFRVMEMLKLQEEEFAYFKGKVPNHSLNYAIGHGLQAVRKSLNGGFAAMRTPEAMALWERQMDPERLASIKEIMHTIWACDISQLNIIEDKLNAAKRYDKTQPDKQLIYISGKISGMEEEAAILFANAKAMLIDKGFEPVNPMELNHKHDQSWSSFMRVDLKVLMDCDGVYFMENWMESEGARIEHFLAEKLGMKMMYEREPQIMSEEAKAFFEEHLVKSEFEFTPRKFFTHPTKTAIN